MQESSWRKTVDLFGQDEDSPRQVALFPEEHAPAQVGVEEFPIVRVRLAQMTLRRPRQWGACWLGCELWEQLGLGEFWRDKLSSGREGTRWDQVLQTLVLYRLIDPGSEWRLHRHWFEHTAIADLLGGRFCARGNPSPLHLPRQARGAPGGALRASRRALAKRVGIWADSKFGGK